MLTGMQLATQPHELAHTQPAPLSAEQHLGHTLRLTQQIRDTHLWQHHVKKRTPTPLRHTLLPASER